MISLRSGYFSSSVSRAARAALMVMDSWLEKAMNRMSLPWARMGSKYSSYTISFSAEVVG